MKTKQILRAFTSLAGVERRGIDEKARTIDFIASTDAEDAHGTVIEQDWKLERFTKNPVVLFMHNSVGESMFGSGGKAKDKIPIARAEDVRVENSQLKLRACFPDEGRSELADAVFAALVDGRLNAVSVGFRGGKCTREELEGGRSRYRLSGCELCEVSVVDIPSNPEAVAERSLLAEMAGEPAHNVTAQAEPAADQARADATPQESSMSLIEILAKRYSCPATEADVLVAIDADKRKAETDARAANVTATLVTEPDAVRVLVITSLGLTDAATEADVSRSIVLLQGRAAKADELEPMVATLSKDLDARALSEAAREVEFVIRRGKDYGFSYDERSRKALAAYRKADPAGFADDHKAALDGLRAFDNPKLFEVVTAGGGAASTTTEETATRAATDSGDDFDARVTAWIEKQSKLGRKLTRSAAMNDVVRNKDQATRA